MQLFSTCNGFIVDAIIQRRLIQRVRGIGTQMKCAHLSTAQVKNRGTVWILITCLFCIIKLRVLSIFMTIAIFLWYFYVSMHYKDINKLQSTSILINLIIVHKKIADVWLPGWNISEMGSQQSARLPNPTSSGQLFFPHTNPGMQSESREQSPSSRPQGCSEVQQPSR